MDDCILVELGGDGIALVTLNRPESRNPLDPEVQEALVAAVLRLDADPAARVAILTGAGSAFGIDNLRVLDIARCSASVVADLFRRLAVPDCATRFHVWLERAADFTFRFGLPDNLEETGHLPGITRLHIEYTSANDLVAIHGTTRTSPFQIIATIPEFFWELSFGIWLLVRGFNPAALAAVNEDQA